MFLVFPLSFVPLKGVPDKREGKDLLLPQEPKKVGHAAVRLMALVGLEQGRHLPVQGPGPGVPQEGHPGLLRPEPRQGEEVVEQGRRGDLIYRCIYEL